MSAGEQPAPGTLMSRWAHLCLTLGLVQGTQSIGNRQRTGTRLPGPLTSRWAHPYFTLGVVQGTQSIRQQGAQEHRPSSAH